ncbi:hypothetical protein Daes_0685 [Pseudodesulfovibrio aespoeensis Aspo-2]|uniref:Uncharacterized protein n=1 Tax=Pseudodesulfovibrio aespoeensis (strain ATCC 700646 / DSM 10631 / Aspo-2) TaxID=643562 RepID=E6VZI8_PSEA9|nr:hypothetical protein Daes_0685 [Pseudodesulfovibrio aespoeensis Aspo-2]
MRMGCNIYKIIKNCITLRQCCLRGLRAVQGACGTKNLILPPMRT